MTLQWQTSRRWTRRNPRRVDSLPQFETAYGQVDAGDTRVFLLDPRVVSAEDKEDLASWKASYSEFKFYEIRIFFEQFASPLIYEPDKRREGKSGPAMP